MLKRINPVIQSPAWFTAFLITAAACVSIYVLNLVMSEARPYTSWGMAYGIAATALLLSVTMYDLRRRMVRFTKRFSLGSTRTWLQFHRYGGMLFLLTMFMHTGFHLPRGALTVWLWALSILTVLSGLLGSALQKWIPKLLTSGLSIEVHYERVAELIEEIKRNAEKLVSSCEPTVQDFYKQQIAPSMAGPVPRMIYYIDITGGIKARTKQFEYLQRFLSPDDKSALQELESIYKTKLEIDAHYTLQRALRWWLYTHIPVSMVLLVLAAVHIFSVLYY